MRLFNNQRRSFLKYSSTVLAIPFIARADSIAERNISRPRLGININSLNDWDSEFPFVDLFKMARVWISQADGKGWGEGPKLEMDESGWIKKLEKNCFATTIITSVGSNNYPSGRYVVLYDGEGKIEFQDSTNQSVVESTPGRIVVNVNSAVSDLLLNVTQVNPNNYIKNIRVILPGFEGKYQANPWNPKFLAIWNGIACLRFMDFMKTNNSKVSKWGDRPKVSDAIWSIKGVPLELMVDLANRLNADAWFCMPHQADDDYVRNFAEYVKRSLNKPLKAWVEYSNEVWNDTFEQSDYASKQGSQLKFASDSWEAGLRYYAYRSVQIFKIWEEVLTDNARLSKVLSSQAANSYLGKQILKFQEAGNHADVLAIAPYISMNITPSKENGIDDKLVANWDIKQLFSYVSNKPFSEALKWMKNNKELALNYNIKLVAYESGQHLLGIFGAENNNKLTSLLKEANHHPAMGLLYSRYYKAWEAVGGDLNCAYNSIGSGSKWGNWGLLEAYKIKPEAAPKYTASINWAISRGQKMKLIEN
jgi:hypothetical protein